VPAEQIFGDWVVDAFPSQKCLAAIEGEFVEIREALLLVVSL
jgi:hypothetical protein